MYFNVTGIHKNDLFFVLFISVCLYRETDKSVKHQISGNYPQANHDER